MAPSRWRAAGGVVWRRDERGGSQVLLVHRARYDDWSLPKGKADPGEDLLLTAVREVGEETGWAVDVGRRLPVVRYDVAGVPKSVRYWSMRARHALGPLRTDGRPAWADVDEVDAQDWFDPDEAAATVSYDGDRETLRAHAAHPPPSAVVLLVRHARAGKRAQWDGDDALRPLDERGRVQADALADHLAAFGTDRLLAADRVRCEQTLGPLARRGPTVVQSEPAVSDEGFADDPDAAVAALHRLADLGGVSVVCSQGGAVPGLLERVVPASLRSGHQDFDTRKAAWWVLGFTGREVRWLDRYDRPR